MNGTRPSSAHRIVAGQFEPVGGPWRSGAVAMVVAALGATAAALFLPTAWFTPVYTHSSLIFPLFPVVASLMAWRRRRTTDQSGAWGWIAAGVVGYYCYEALWYLGRLGGGGGLETVAEVVSLVAAPLVLVGALKGGPQSLDHRERSRGRLDAVILAMGSATLAFAIVTLGGGQLRPITSWRDPILLASPALDLITVGGLALLWIRGEGGRMPEWAGTITIALLVGLVADLWFATPASVGVASPWFVRGAWYGNWAAIGVAAVQALDVVPRFVAPGRISRLPNLIAMACYLCLALAVALDLRWEIIALTASVGVLTILVVVRDSLALSDLTKMRAEQVRTEADTRLAALVRHGSDMLTIIDQDLRIRYASPSHWSILGLAADALMGRPLTAEMHWEDVAETERGIERLLRGSVREALVFRLKDASGQWRWIEAVGTNLLDEPSIRGLVLNARDISDRKRLEVELLEQALRDPLTGLANRRLFGDRLAHALARRHRRPGSVAVLLLDLDHFKVVNDSLGHAKGDALLIAVGERLRTALREADTVARLGGDEFAILLEDLANPTEADATAGRIQEAFSRPFLLDDREVVVRASIGIAWATEDQQVDDLLTDADVAMYGAKSSGRGRTERFSTSMRAIVAERHDVEADLRTAVDRDEFEVLYQPVVDLKTGRVGGAEALVRWRHPTKGVILPARFIPIAEESDLILAIGKVVVRRAARDAALFRAARPDAGQLRVAVNLSARQLLSADLVQTVLAAARAAGIDGSALAIELTESVLASSEAVVADRLQQLRDVGVSIALDDFGTGYSALAYLRHFPIDVLKVDKSFVSWVRDGGASDGVTKAIIAMGQSLSMRTIAEGIETLDQLEWLRSLGCSFGQGYLFARPVPPEAFVELLRDWDPGRFTMPARVHDGAIPV